MAPAIAEARKTDSNGFGGGVVSICGDENEWPPYTYFKRSKGEKTQQVTGYSIAVVEAIFSRHRINYTIRLLPWTRCVAELKSGQRYQMILDMSANPERRADFLLTKPYYTTIPHYFYSRHAYPQGLHLNTLAELGRHTICGLQGYNYVQYGLDASKVDQGAKSYQAVIAKLHAARCSLFIEQFEAMLGFSLIGTPFLDDQRLAHAPIPGLRPSVFYMGISRNFPQGEALKALLDRDLGRMEVSGQLKSLWKTSIGK